jgi:hypothetical protein
MTDDPINTNEVITRRQAVFDAIVSRVLALEMETTMEKARERATVMINRWSNFSKDSMDDHGHLTVYDWLDPELCRLLDEDEGLRYGSPDVCHSWGGGRPHN